MLPDSGALVLTIPGITGVSVNATTTGALVQFMWPFTARLATLDLTTRDGAQASMANVRLRMLDDDSNELFVDGRAIQRSAPALGLRGIQPFFALIGGGRPIPFQRIVRTRDRWRFQIVNDNAFAVVPELTFRFGKLVP